MVVVILDRYTKESVWSEGCLAHNFLRNLYSVSPNSDSNLRPQQKHTRVPSSIHHCQHLFFLKIIFIGMWWYLIEALICISWVTLTIIFSLPTNHFYFFSILRHVYLGTGDTVQLEECLPGMSKTQDFIPSTAEIGMVTRVCNPSPLELETGGPRAQGHHLLPRTENKRHHTTIHSLCIRVSVDEAFEDN